MAGTTPGTGICDCNENRLAPFSLCNNFSPDSPALLREFAGKHARRRAEAMLQPIGEILLQIRRKWSD
jgi:hypothetical protein